MSEIKSNERNANYIAFGKSFKSLEEIFIYFMAILYILFSDPSATTASLGLIGIVFFGIVLLVAREAMSQRDLEDLTPDKIKETLQLPVFQTIANPITASKFMILVSLAVFAGSNTMLLFTLIFASIFYYFIAIYEDDYCRLVLDEDYSDYRDKIPLWFPNKWKRFNCDLEHLRRSLNRNKKFFTIILGALVIILLLD